LLDECVAAKAADAWRADGEIAFLGRLEFRAWLLFITLRNSSIVCCGVSGLFDTGATLPSIFTAGGNPAVMNKSDPFCLTSRSSSSWMNLVAVSRSMAGAS